MLPLIDAAFEGGLAAVTAIFLDAFLALFSSLVVQLIKNLPAMQETWVRSLGWEDPLEKGNPLQYSGLENPHGQRSLADYIPWGCKESDTTEIRDSQLK